MLKKSIIGLIALIAAIGLVFAAYGDGDNDVSTQKSINSHKQNKSVESSESTTKASAKANNQISEERAQKIAQKYIEEPGAKAGKPKLGDMDGKKVYTVPVLLKGDTVGEIYISATTGKNLGGAGGVS